MDPPPPGVESLPTLCPVHWAVACAAHAARTLPQIVAYVGGIDLTVGRYDTPKHQLFSTLKTTHGDDWYQNCHPELDAAYGPRQPWHDIHSKVEGPAARDVLNNFEMRWQKQVGGHGGQVGGHGGQVGGHGGQVGGHGGQVGGHGGQVGGHGGQVGGHGGQVGGHGGQVGGHGGQLGGHGGQVGGHGGQGGGHGGQGGGMGGRWGGMGGRWGGMGGR